MAMIRLLVLALLTGSALSGCTSPVKDAFSDTSTPSPPTEHAQGTAPGTSAVLSEFWDNKTQEEVVAAAPTIGCDVERQVPCFDYPLTVEKGQTLAATLTWPGQQRMSITLYQGDARLKDAHNLIGDPGMRIEYTLDAGIDYLLQVTTSGPYSLHILLQEPSARRVYDVPPAAFGPHVVLGFTDTGINPYHELFYRPHLTEHPCTYVRDVPCDLQELRLSVGETDWKAAMAKDEATWANLAPDTWYWIPQTVFIAVSCTSDDPYALFGEICLLDDGGDSWAGHGTATTSIAMMQNPDAFIAFHEGHGILPFALGRIPVDVYSYSWGGQTPYPYPQSAAMGMLPCPALQTAPLIVKAGGNDGRLVLTDCQDAYPQIIAAGGGFTEPRAHSAGSASMTDVESYMMPPYARRDSTNAIAPAGSWGGTSFATPAIAGALGKVVLEVRQASRYDGSLTKDGFIDPILGITAGDVREAMNRTSTYDPAPKHGGGGINGVPVNPAAPWLQWGWGFYDGDIANATIAHLLDTTPSPEKPEGARQYMETLAQLRRTIYG